ncbi:MAG: hypothetical protein GX187_07460 [Clostridiaceae bacterium]|nr:hypothetical protein [Clostridiaceae bacterium]
MRENNNVYYGDEIDLKELVLVLWGKKYVIIAATLVFAIFAGLFSFLLLPEVYETKLDIVINMPGTYSTRYGDYTLPITSNDEYINLIFSNDVILRTISDMGYEGVSVENLRKRITKVQTQTNNNGQNNKNMYEIKVSAGSPDEALNLARSLYRNYIEFLDVMTKEMAIKYFHNYFTVRTEALNFELEKTRELLQRNEALLAETPRTINQIEAMNTIKDNINDFVVLENIINPNYTKIESDIISNRQAIANMEETISEYRRYLAELEEEMKALDEYYKSGGTTQLDTRIKSIAETSIYLPSDPIAPGQKSSPHNFRNAAIGGVLGGMISVLVVLVKYYWFESEKHQKIQTAYNFNIDKQ